MSIGLALVIFAVVVFGGFLGFKIAGRKDGQGSGGSGGGNGRNQRRK